MAEYAPDALRWLGRELPAKLGGQLSGIVGDRAHTYGYHRGRNYVSAGDYSRQLPEDRAGDGEAASAIDWSLNTSQMKLYTQRLVDATSRRDPRVRYLREFYGTTNGSSVTGRIHDGENAGWRSGSSDSSHLWHIHMSFFRKYSNSMEAVQAVFDVLAGRASTPAPEPTPSGEDEMTNNELPRGFAFGLGGPMDPSKVLTVGLPGKADVYFTTDFAGDPGVKLRVAIHDGAGWAIHHIDVPSGRGKVPVRGVGKSARVEAKNVTGSLISVGREKRSDTDGASQMPVTIMVEKMN